MAEQAITLLGKLRSELQDQKLSDSDRAKLLEQLKVIGRNPSQAVPIFEKQNVQILCKYAFETSICSASREAMRCLANAMLLDEGTRQTFVDLEYPGPAAERLKNDDRDDEFLASRLIFFSTYTGKLDIPTLINKHDLADSITKNLGRAVSQLDSKPPDTNPIARMAHQETLKLIYNLVYYSPDSTTSLYPALTPLATLFLRTPLPTPALQPPITLMINALLNLNPQTSQLEDATLRDPLYPPSDPTALTTKLVSILSPSLPPVLTPQSDAILSPLLSLLRTLHSSAPDPAVRASLKSQLLPPPSARDKVLGTDSSLPSRLLRAAVDPSTSTLRDVVAALLFELSSSSATELVANIGYGYAVGILARLGVEADPATLGGAVDGVEGEVNPITGQRRDMETEPVEEVEMTEEEKEREAERLFVLFERLKATGVVDVKNPVELAREQGKFQD
ncbi:hypothetical protein K461DRAFT_294758 [Myriangium duriaei CBS 260.36]|uniref:Guanine nucleotide exchange factor synembryn n=1 Tax=Myriangium duriaei CBS 260.36 TaxID=1168546 RepID=A0A9P4J255_9PEZI|nr:hypothetical protein K461DRAFT_294758 [Myriangium duriaei CBS 260.36]